MKNKIIKLHRLGDDTLGKVGGKGLSLSRLTDSGFRVPPAFAIDAAVFDEAISLVGIGSILTKVRENPSPTECEQIAIKLAELIPLLQFPDALLSPLRHELMSLGGARYAVRSSATVEDGENHAWAGQFESFLNVSAQEVAPSIVQCWASAFSIRCLNYAAASHVPLTSVRVAVVVQRMVDAMCAGTAFTAHVTTGRRDRVIVQSVPGLADRLVSGEISPDTHILDHEGNVVEEAVHRSFHEGSDGDVAHQTKLRPTQVKEIGETAVAIQRCYGSPRDIEWAIDHSGLWIVQARPITRLPTDWFSHRLTKVDWTRFLERRRSCFLYHPFAEAEMALLEAEVGFRFRHRMFKWAGDRGVHYRSQAELTACDQTFVQLVQTRGIVDKWLSNGRLWQSKLHDCLKELDGEPDDQIADHFEHIYPLITRVLLHTVTIPYLALSAIESLSLDKSVAGQPLDKPEFQRAIKSMEELRLVSCYSLVEERVLERIFSALGTAWNVDSDLANMATPEEIRDFVLHKKVPDVEMLESRRTWCVFWHNPEDPEIPQWQHILERQLTAALPVLSDPIPQDGMHEVTGTVGFSGEVEGVVARLDNAHDMERFEPGQVIVSINTNPSLMPALRECSGIVSDEGGLTCHAAIVARELRKPCIVGTKIASGLFSSGDGIRIEAYSNPARAILLHKSAPKVTVSE